MNRNKNNHNFIIKLALNKRFFGIRKKIYFEKLYLSYVKNVCVFTFIFYFFV